MRFLVDECTGPAVARWLRDRSHEVFSVYEEARGMGDDEILDKAFSEDWIVITNDKDFGWPRAKRETRFCMRGLQMHRDHPGGKRLRRYETGPGNQGEFRGR